MNKQLLSLGLTFFKKTFLLSILLVALLIIIEPNTTNNFKLWKFSKENYFVFLAGYKSESFILNVLSNRTDLTLFLKRNQTLNSSLECPLIPNNLSNNNYY